MSTYIKNLQQIGLNTNQAKTYLACLELGPSTIIRLAKHTHIIRTTIYDHIRILKEYGLITETIKDGKHLFVAESPHKLANILESKKQVIEECIPGLLSIFDSSNIKPIQFFEGIKGIEKILDLSWQENHQKVTRLIGDVQTLFSWIPEPSIKSFTIKRVKKAIKNYLVVTTETEALKKLNMLNPARHKTEFRQVRIAPQGTNFPLMLYSFDHKVALISSTKEGYSILIESPEFAETFRSLFKLIWPLSTDVSELNT